METQYSEAARLRLYNKLKTDYQGEGLKDRVAFHGSESKEWVIGSKKVSRFSFAHGALSLYEVSRMSATVNGECVGFEFLVEDAVLSVLHYFGVSHFNTKSPDIIPDLCKSFIGRYGRAFSMYGMIDCLWSIIDGKEPFTLETECYQFTSKYLFPLFNQYSAYCRQKYQEEVVHPQEIARQYEHTGPRTTMPPEVKKSWDELHQRLIAKHGDPDEKYSDSDIAAYRAAAERYQKENQDPMQPARFEEGEEVDFG